MNNSLKQILKIRAQTLAMIEELTLSPKPSYAIENQSVSWESYLKQLQETVSWCDQQIQAEETFEIHSIART